MNIITIGISPITNEKNYFSERLLDRLSGRFEQSVDRLAVVSQGLVPKREAMPTFVCDRENPFGPAHVGRVPLGEDHSPGFQIFEDAVNTGNVRRGVEKAGNVAEPLGQFVTVHRFFGKNRQNGGLQQFVERCPDAGAIGKGRFLRSNGFFGF